MRKKCNHIRDVKDLGAAIRERRRKLGWGQEDLATRVGVTRQWIIEIEHGKPRSALGLVLRTLHALGLDVSLGEAPVDGKDDQEADIDAVVRRARTTR